MGLVPGKWTNSTLLVRRRTCQVLVSNDVHGMKAAFDFCRHELQLLVARIGK